MTNFIIEGGNPLKGAVRLGGAKNASFKLMIASLLNSGESRLLNFSKIADVEITKKIIKALGGTIKECGERTLFINATKLRNYRVPKELGLASRASSLFIAPLLSRLKKAVVPLPGGDKIGKRPLDRHFDGLKSLGAKVELINGMYQVTASKLKGSYFKFPKNTHTGTETLIMAAVLAKGKTVLDNAALEPEVDDLICFLNKMGGRIKRLANRRIEINGVKKLKPVIYRVMPDRNEAVSYAIVALVTKGDIIVENANPNHLKFFLDKISQVGGNYEIGNYGIRFFYKNALKATNIITKPHPGFMTDWQPLWSVLASQSKGQTSIVETIHISRFQYVDQLKKMGAKISYFQPIVKDPQGFYNFNLEDDKQDYFHGIKIKGPSRLEAITADVSDLRAGATLTIAGLIAQGKTVLTNIEHIDRGYENLDGRLVELGAKITRV